MQILRANSFEEFRESVFPVRNRFDDNAAGFLAHVHGVIQAELGGLQDSGRNAHRSAVAPFLDDGFHSWSSPPCRNIVSRSSPFLVFSPLATRHSPLFLCYAVFMANT